MDTQFQFQTKYINYFQRQDVQTGRCDLSIMQTLTKGASDLIGTKNVKMYIEICYEEEKVSVCSPFANTMTHL